MAMSASHHHLVAFFTKALRPMPKKHTTKPNLCPSSFVARFRKTHMVHTLPTTSICICRGHARPRNSRQSGIPIRAGRPLWKCCSACLLSRGCISKPACNSLRIQARVAASVAHLLSLRRRDWHQWCRSQNRHRVWNAHVYSESFLAGETHAGEVAPNFSQSVLKVS